jgi:hypothetical protein
MKGTLIIIVLLLVASPVPAELTKEDLQAIETIIEKSEARTKEYIDSKYNQVTTKIDEMDKRLTAQIDGVDKRLVDMRSFLIGLIALIAVAIGVPAWIWNKSQKDDYRPAPRENQTDEHVPLNGPKSSSSTPAD